MPCDVLELTEPFLFHRAVVSEDPPLYNTSGGVHTGNHAVSLLDGTQKQEGMLPSVCCVDNQNHTVVPYVVDRHVTETAGKQSLWFPAITSP